jgi:uncharacterized protein (DUF885 family)
MSDNIQINDQTQDSFDRLVAAYMEDAYRFHPGLATFVGVHSYDAEMEDYRAESIQSEIESIKSYSRRLDQIDGSALDISGRVDYRIIENNIKARLLELEEIRSFEVNPYVYCEALSHTFLRQVLFDYASPESRLADVIAKEGKIPRMVESAKKNLKNPPPAFIDVGLLGLIGTLSLVERDLPSVFAEVGDERLRAKFQASTEKAAEALNDLISYVDNDLRAHANGDFALGERNYRAKLRYEEGVEYSLEQLLSLARNELAHTQQEFMETARRVDPKQQPIDTWRRIQKQHPAAGTLVETAQAQLESILSFIKEKKLLSWPSAEPAEVASTPEFYRWSFASMVAPGPLESHPSTSRYYITDVDPVWEPEKQAAHMTYFSYPILWSISIHEVYPGHYVQFAYLPKVRSRVRKDFICMPMTYVEGWAHYAEQMMFEEGFLADQPEMRLGQLWEALLRLCRFIVAIELHTREMNIEQATQFFVDNAYAEPIPSQNEAERGTFDPMYLSYSLGKLEILKLREDYKRARGSDFNLAEFHHKLLGEGMAPIAYHRELMLGGSN